MQNKPLTIAGKHNTAIVYTHDVEQGALDQIRRLCDCAAFADSRIRIMSDVHMGVGCTIGTTMTITDKVVPHMVGVDIGCGIRTVQLAAHTIDYAALDAYIRRNIRAGAAIRDAAHRYAAQIDLTQLRCARHIKYDRAIRSIGTLGGGNHFIEVDTDDEGNLYLVVHTGSRHLGIEVADYYQQAAIRQLAQADADAREALAAQMRAEGRQAEIEAALREMRPTSTRIPPELAYVQGALLEDYLHDMRITQHFACLNRQAIAEDIIEGLCLGKTDEFETIHNYIDLEHRILRKGAISAQKGERLLIPLNMRDGALVCVGKGNPDWNYSAPHGAGRKLSRSRAKATLSMDEYHAQMQGIYTTSICTGTLDESPMAYKSMYEIIANIRPTVAVHRRIMPTYNFKSPEK